MNTNEPSLRRKALELPEAEEAAHLEKTCFTLRKKIFATINPKANRACFKRSETDQQVFSKISNASVYAVPNKWGKHGCTNVDLGNVE